jgi:hypothetical protein
MERRQSKGSLQGCQMVYFQTKNWNLGIFRKVLQCKTLVYFMDILVYVLYGPIVYFFGHLLYFVVILSIYPVLVFCTKKNLATLARSCRTQRPRCSSLSLGSPWDLSLSGEVVRKVPLKAINIDHYKNTTTRHPSLVRHLLDSLSQRHGYRCFNKFWLLSLTYKSKYLGHFSLNYLLIIRRVDF